MELYQRLPYKPKVQKVYVGNRDVKDLLDENLYRKAQVSGLPSRIQHREDIYIDLADKNVRRIKPFYNERTGHAGADKDSEPFDFDAGSVA